MILALHQPNYLPYFGNFHKMAHVDLYVFFDTVPVPQGKSWVSRNRISLNGQEMWLTVPTRKSGRSGQFIKDVETRWDTPWTRKHLKTIQMAYRKSQHLDQVIAVLEQAYGVQPTYLADLNIAIIQGLANLLGIRCQFARASGRVSSDSRGTAMIQEVCQAFGCTDYLTGTGYDRFEAQQLEEVGIRVHEQHFQHPVYESLGGQFIPNLSILDALLSCGPEQVSKWLHMPQEATPRAEAAEAEED